jgi:hypothetical protein
METQAARVKSAAPLGDEPAGRAAIPRQSATSTFVKEKVAALPEACGPRSLGAGTGEKAPDDNLLNRAARGRPRPDQNRRR